MIRPRLVATLLLAALAGCGTSLSPGAAGAGASLRSTVQEAFWQRLGSLCGQAYEGRMVEGSDSTFIRNRVLIHVRDCSENTVRIGFVIGPDPSRTWVIRRVDGALSLRHDVAGGGTDREPSGYGGLTTGPGTPTVQEFHADSATAHLLPPAAHNVWLIELDPGRTLAYTVARPGVARRFRLEFDLRHPVAPPPAPR